MVRIAVLGCGRIGAMHAANIAAHPRATLAGVYDIHAPAATPAGLKTGAKDIASVEAVFASDEVDAVLIATATDTNSRQSAYGYDQRVEAFGTKGMAISETRRPHGVTLHTLDFSDRAEPLLNFFIERYREGFDAEISEFVEAVGSGRAPAVGFEDGLMALVLAEAALKSIADGRLVAVKESA